jgi:hypothetical protein
VPMVAVRTIEEIGAQLPDAACADEIQWRVHLAESAGSVKWLKPRLVQKLTNQELASPTLSCITLLCRILTSAFPDSMRRCWYHKSTLAIYHPPDWLLAIVFFELAALVIWLFLPLIRQYLFQILLPIAWLVPAFVVDDRIRGKTDPSFWLPLLALIWGAWLFSPVFFRAWPWRIVFWAGTLALAGYLVCGPGAL